MSLAAAALVWWHVATVGVTTPEPDEGLEARLFQLLVVLQAPIVLIFAVSWLPERPREALPVLLLQGVALSVAFGSLFWFEHLATR